MVAVPGGDRRYAPDGTAVTNFGLAFHRHYRTREGRSAEHTGFVNIVTYQRLAEVCGQYLTKGSAVLVEGRLQMREWQTPRGDNAARMEVRGEMVHFLERRPEGAPPIADEAPADGSEPASDELF